LIGADFLDKCKVNIKAGKTTIKSIKNSMEEISNDLSEIFKIDVMSKKPNKPDMSLTSKTTILGWSCKF